MSSTPVIIFLAALLICIHGANSFGNFDVKRMGAVADGRTDDSAVFLRAWRGACSRTGFNRIYVPPGTYKLFPVRFEGPCRGTVELRLKGVLKASPSPVTLNFDHWITFHYINGLTIRGGGTFDGQGPSAWPYNNCARNPGCRRLPVSIRFDFVTNALIRSVRSLNSKNFHFNLLGCRNVKFLNVKIVAPDESPNTDGIHIGRSSEIMIHDSLIATGDDCISLGPGSRHIDIRGVRCGPGHGISIGSLGKYKDEEEVAGVRVRNCTLSWTENGLRIKTWESPLGSRATNLTFENIVMHDVRNPIFIDQSYCPSGGCKPKIASQVQIENVFFHYIRGTSLTENAVSFLCSPLRPCKNVRMKDIDLRYNGPGRRGRSARASCYNVRGAAWGFQNPPACI